LFRIELINADLMGTVSLLSCSGIELINANEHESDEGFPAK